MISMTTGRNPNIGPKIVKEKNVVSKMIGLYCEKKHNSLKGALCEDCSNLQEYSHHRLDHCRYKEEKPTDEGENQISNAILGSQIGTTSTYRLGQTSNAWKRVSKFTNRMSYWIVRYNN